MGIADAPQSVYVLVNKTRVGLAARSQHRCELHALRTLVPTTSDLGSPSRSSPLRPSRAPHRCYRILTSCINTWLRVYNIHKSILYVRLYHTVRGINAPGSPNLPKTAKKPKWAYPNVLARRFDRYHIENPLSRLNRPAPRGHFGPPRRPKSIRPPAKVFLRCVIQRTCNSLILHINVCNSMLLRPLRLRLAPA